MDTAFWHGKRVFLTGHTGFKGSWLALWLQSLGSKVMGYSLEAPTEPSLFHVARVGDGMLSIHGDIRDLDALSAAMEHHQPQIVIHMAAQALVRRSYRDPVDTYATNVMGTVHVMEAIRRVGGVRAVINVTSDKCYENREWVWGYREIDPMGGYDPYSSSKGCAELVGAAYRSAFFNPAEYATHGVAVASVRAGNVIGGGDWAEDRLLPDLFRAIFAGRPVVIRNPDAVRPWQHVLEPLSGYMLLAQRLYEDGAAFAEAWNFGPRADDAWPVSSVMDRTVAMWGEGATWRVEGAASHPYEAGCLKLDCSKAQARLGWKPRWSVENALEKTVAWYKAYGVEGDMRVVTLKQIGEHSLEVGLQL